MTWLIIQLCTLAQGTIFRTMLKKYIKHKITPAWSVFHSTQLNTIYLTLIVLSTTSLTYCAPCLEDFWWDPVKDSCIKCTICDDQSIVLRPCQPHKDTVCGSLNDLEFDWDWLNRREVPVEPNWKERPNDPESAKKTNEIMWDWQAASLTLIAIVCLLLFILAAYISFQHAKQWRQMEKMERRFDKDVEELSTRLMSTIVNIRSIENGRIILEEQSKEKIFNPLEVRCVYLEQLLAKADLAKHCGRGNVYIEESNATK